MAKVPVEQVQVKGVTKQRMIVTIKGTTSLLMSRPPEHDEKRTDEQRFEEAKYYLSDGKTLAFPAGGLRKSLIRAANFLTGTNMTKARSSLFVYGEDDLDMLTIKCDEVKIFRKRPRNGNGQLVPSIRAECINWETTVIIEFNSEVLSPEQVLRLVEIAGFGVGLGSWRPECGGMWGRFENKRKGGKKLEKAA